MDTEKANQIAKSIGTDGGIMVRKVNHTFSLVVFFIASFVLVIGILGALSLQRVWVASHSFATTDVPALSNLYTLEEILSREGTSIDKLSDLSSKVNSEILNLALQKEFINFEGFIAENHKAIDDSFKNLEIVISDNEERSFLTKARERYVILEEKRSELSTAIRTFLRLNVVSKNYATEKLVVERLLSQMSNTKSQVQEQLFSLSHVIKVRISDNASQLSLTHTKVRRNLLYVSFLGLFIAALTGLYIGRRAVLQPVARTEQHVEELSKLNSELNRTNKLLVEREIALSDLNRKLQEQDAHRAEFVSIVAHQLRTPLAGIKWTLDMLGHGDMGSLNLDQKSMVMKMLESNERLIRFVNDLLSLSRIESGRMEYNFVPVNLQHVAESVLLDIFPIANRKQVNINFRGKGLTMPTVAADTDKIRAVYQNLLENAVKYSPIGGKIILELRNRGNDILTTVSDNGIGIPKDQQKNIFSRFYRAANAIKLLSEGSGLGLYLVKNVVESHGGKVWFESDLGRGTTFYFTIPVPNSTPI